ncbi:MAG: hypothetical protein IKJ27_02695, partial [Clostridia bacterium]|nr:hypothetical protein [Clostridia bacterium]
RIFVSINKKTVNMRIKINTIFSREFCDSYQYDVIRKIEKLLDEELSHRFQSDLIETFDITVICMSPAFGNFVKAKRPKYYADKTLKPSNSITPVATLLKYFTAEFIMNFDAFYKAEEKECFSVLGYAILNFIEALKYPAALKKFEKEKLLQTVRDILIENSIISVHDSI